MKNSSETIFMPIPIKPRGPYKTEEEIRSIVWRGVNYNESEMKEIREAHKIKCQTSDYNPNKNPGGPRGSYNKKNKKEIVWRGVGYSLAEKVEIDQAIDILKKGNKKENDTEYIRDGVLKKTRRIINAHNKKKGINSDENI